MLDWGGEGPLALLSHANGFCAGVWTRMRIVVSGETAMLHVGNADQPALVIRDLKRGEAAGGIGLWVGPGTVGYFRNLRVRPAAAVAKAARP